MQAKQRAASVHCTSKLRKPLNLACVKVSLVAGLRQRTLAPPLRAIRVECQRDVVVIGAGVIGLACARRILQVNHAVDVMVLDAGLGLCTGATGAGQGYLWCCHRDPADLHMWALARSGQDAWANLARVRSGECAALSYQESGSLLVAPAGDAVPALVAQHLRLMKAGVKAEMLTAEECEELEPLICLPREGAAMRVATDAQLDARGAAAFLLHECQRYGSRFRIHFGVVVEELKMGCCTGAIQAVRTENETIECRQGAVLAMGCASAELIAVSFHDNSYKGMLQPRCGFLVDIPYCKGATPLRHGVMEVAYTQHYTDSKDHGEGHVAAGAAACFTATTSSNGHLLVGSSRQDCTASSADPNTVSDMLKHAAGFLRDPGLLESGTTGMAVRAGDRPASDRGRPYIGAVPGCRHLVLAAGHEGSGLTMALSTAELVCSALDLQEAHPLQGAFAW